MQKLFGEEPVLIKVTRLDGTEVVLNSDLIEFVQATPDTVISLTNSKKVLVKESIEEVLERIVEYKRRMCDQFLNDQSRDRQTRRSTTGRTGEAPEDK